MAYLTGVSVFRGYPFDTGCWPLGYSGNAGVHGVSDRGLNGWPQWVREGWASGGGEADHTFRVHLSVRADPWRLHFTVEPLLGEPPGTTEGFCCAKFAGDQPPLRY